MELAVIGLDAVRCVLVLAGAFLAAEVRLTATKETMTVDCCGMARNETARSFEVTGERSSATASGEIARGVGLSTIERVVLPATKVVMRRLVQTPARPAANVRLTVQPFPLLNGCLTTRLAGRTFGEGRLALRYLNWP